MKALLLTAFPAAPFLHCALHHHTDHPTCLVLGLCSRLCPDALLHSVAAPASARRALLWLTHGDCLFRPARGGRDSQQELPMGAASQGSRTGKSPGAVSCTFLFQLSAVSILFITKGKERWLWWKGRGWGGSQEHRPQKDAGGLLCRDWRQKAGAGSNRRSEIQRQEGCLSKICRNYSCVLELSVSATLKCKHETHSQKPVSIKGLFSSLTES